MEEAYRSNAGIVGPKIVDRDNPDVLLEVGMSIDHYGVPFSGIEPDEVDQEQHDGVRDVFYVSHVAMLVRADLFHELGGFDPETSPGADDIDLCWRARLAGARVIVVPDARVREGREATADSRRGTRSARTRASRRDPFTDPSALQVVLRGGAALGAPGRVRAQRGRGARALGDRTGGAGAGSRRGLVVGVRPPGRAPPGTVGDATGSQRRRPRRA